MYLHHNYVNPVVSFFNSLCSVQELEVISGFQRLRYLNRLHITENPRLVAVDGLHGVTEVVWRADIINNPHLCYSLDSLADKQFWEVVRTSYTHTLHL